MKNLKNTDLNTALRISLHELAAKFTTTIPKLLQICKTLGIGVVTKHDNTYIERTTDQYDNVFTEIEAYVKNEDIENKVLAYIKKHQPTTANQMVVYFGVSHKVIDRVLANITFADPMLWGEQRGKKELLYYGYGGWEE